MSIRACEVDVVRRRDRGEPLGVSLNLNLELTLNHVPFGLYGEKTRVFLRKRSGESHRHVMMKWLSYMVFYHPGLKIELSAAQHFKPDLVRLDGAGEPLQWVDCGQTSLAKLDKISRKNQRAIIDIVKALPGELVAYAHQAQSRLARPERVRYLSFEGALVDRLGEHLHRRHAVEATVTQDFEHVYLVIDGAHELDAPLFRLWREVPSPVVERAAELGVLRGL